MVVAGKSVGKLRGRRGARVDLRSRPAGTVRVRIVMRLRGGRTVTDTPALPALRQADPLIRRLTRVFSAFRAG